jgi:hypothetical protein
MSVKINKNMTSKEDVKVGWSESSRSPKKREKRLPDKVINHHEGVISLSKNIL